MPLDFPSSPTVGQQYLNWTWNGTAWIVAPGPPLASLAQSAQNAGRNYLDNALFRIFQRGLGPFTANLNYTADRYVTGINLDTNSFSVVALTDAQRTQIGDESAIYGLQNTFTGNAGAAAFSLIAQNIESVRRLAGKTVTISFFAQSSGPMNLGVGAAQVFGTGGSPSSTVILNGQSVQITPTFARYSVSFNVPSTAGKTLGSNLNDYMQVSWWYSSGANNAVAGGNPGVQSGVVTLWGMQVEVGAQATPLEKLVPEVDLARCQRFYQAPVMVWALYQAAGAIFQVSMPISPTMRATPTAALVPGNTISNLSGFSLSALPNLLWTNGTVQTTGGVTITSNVTLSADL